jgi:sigma-54 dependent transcriptional regulator, acetoin dehydrogenase operon transcriptional activator AcoR
LGGLKTAADRTDLRDALDEFLSTGTLNAEVRPEIAGSWHRSMGSALHPDRLEVPFASGSDGDDRIVRAARPVLDRLVDDLDFVSMSVVLADQSGRVVDRLVSDRKLETQLDGVMFAPGFGFGEGQVGTNGIGTSLERGAPFMVTGSEHFVGRFTHMACAAAPIVDPTTGSVLGVVDLTCPVDSSHALMLAMAKRSAREIEARLVSGNPQADRVLLERFLRARRGSRGALVALNGQVMYTNAPAVRLMRGVDRAVLWDLVASALFDQRRGLLHIPFLPAGSSLVSCEAIEDGGELTGALLRFLPAEPAAMSSHPRALERRPRRPTVGWESLTETERSVAGLVTEGRTNREVAASLFLSHHTVGYHLRHIFGKLGIDSRVELTRLMVERTTRALLKNHNPP